MGFLTRGFWVAPVVNSVFLFTIHYSAIAFTFSLFHETTAYGRGPHKALPFRRLHVPVPVPVPVRSAGVC